MTVISKLTCACLAVIAFGATDPVRAGSPSGSIHLQCDGMGLAPFCAALGNALQHAQPTRHVTLSSTANGKAMLTVRFEPTRQSAQLLSGYLVWRDASGASGQGPEGELAVLDSVITDDLLRGFAVTLVQHSNIPL